MTTTTTTTWTTTSAPTARIPVQRPSMPHADLLVARRPAVGTPPVGDRWRPAPSRVRPVHVEGPSIPAFPPLPDPRPARADRGVVALIAGAVAAGVLGLGVLTYATLAGDGPVPSISISGPSR